MSMPAPITDPTFNLAQTVRSALAYALWRHQGSSSPVGQPIRRMLGMAPDQELSEDDLIAAKSIEGAFEMMIDRRMKFGHGTIGMGTAYFKDQATRDAFSARLALADRYEAINTPEIADFIKAIELEALHQRERWGVDHDAGKDREDWVTLLIALIGKAVKSHWEKDNDKVLHHIITVAAVCLNWHAAEVGAHNRMRPGVGP